MNIARVPLLLAGLLLISILSNAQTTISGKVKTADGEPLPGVSLKIKFTSDGGITDSMGTFEIKTNIKGSSYLIASAIGFHPDSTLIKINGKEIFHSFVLKENKNELQGVQIQIRRNLSEVNRDYTQSAISTAMTAGTAADVTAALQTFPGAAPAGNETGFFVHGGSASETAIMFDGLMVKNAFGSRLPDLANRSRFSTFLFDKSTFTTNGFSAAYGQALSSVLSMDTKGIAQKSSTEYSIINLGFGAASTQRFKNSSLTLGANYYNFKPYNSVVNQYTLWQQAPRQYQTSLSYKLKPSKNGMIKVFADYSDTELSFDIKNPIVAAKDLLHNRNKNIYLNTNYQDYLTENWKIYAGVGYNRTLESGHVNKDSYFQTDNIWQEKLMITRLLPGSSTVSIGAEQFQNSREEGYAEGKRSYKDVLSAGFAESEIYFNNQLSLKLGLRSEYSSFIRKSNLTPRTAFIFMPYKDHQITTSYGLYYQKPDDSFLAETSALGYEKSEQFAVDYEYKMLNRLFRITAYYKDYDDLLKIKTPVFSGFQAYGPPLQISEFNHNGSGYAKGIDVFYKDKQSLELVEFYASYSYLDTKRNYIDYPDFGRPAFAPEHTFNFVLQKARAKVDWFFSAAYTYSTGRTYYNPLNPVFMGNNTKDYHSISFSATYLPKWIGKFSAFNLNVNNIFGFNNVFGYRYSYDGARRETIWPPAKRNFLLSFLMNLDGDEFNH
jgi:hypothetical protein